MLCTVQVSGTGWVQLGVKSHKDTVSIFKELIVSWGAEYERKIEEECASLPSFLATQHHLLAIILEDWRQEKGKTEDETVGWHHWFNGHEFEQAPGVGDGQGSLACCSPWGRRESDMTEQLNWTLCYIPECWVRLTSSTDKPGSCTRQFLDFLPSLLTY